MANYKNKTKYHIGDILGHWEIIGDSDKKGYNNSTYVKCKCVCGKIKDVDIHNLKRGLSKSCGCIKPISPRKYIPINIGDHFGKLTIIEKNKNSGKNCWKCKCECGNMTNTSGYRLTNGMTKVAAV